MDEAPQPQFGFSHDTTMISDIGGFLVICFVLSFVGLAIAFPIRSLGVRLAGRFHGVAPIMLAAALAVGTTVSFYLISCLMLSIPLFDEFALFMTVVVSIGTPVFLLSNRAIEGSRHPNRFRQRS